MFRPIDAESSETREGTEMTTTKKFDSDTPEPAGSPGAARSAAPAGPPATIPSLPAVASPPGPDRSAEINALTSRIIGAAITVHRALGPGLLEATNETFLAAELRSQNLNVQRQVPVPVVYRGQRLEVGYRIDLLVERKVVVEVKVVESIAPVHVSQVLTYLRLANLEAGLIFNFNTDALAAGGIKRVVRGGTIRRPSEPPPR